MFPTIQRILAEVMQKMDATHSNLIRVQKCTNTSSTESGKRESDNSGYLVSIS